MNNARLRASFALVAVAALALAGCASTPSGSATSATKASDASCVPPPPSTLPKDPDGVISKLGAAATDALKGYPGSVYASPWSTFTPKSAPPWSVGYSGNVANPANEQMQQGIQEVMDAHPDLFQPKLQSVIANPANDAASQIQGMRTLLQQGVDIILAPLASSTALNGVIDDAAAQGVPVISLLGQSTSKNAVNVQPNPVDDGYLGAAGVAKKIGGKGNVLMVHGIPGLSIDTQIYDAGKAVFDACKGIKVVGELTGNFDPATAKTETLKFFTTHPGTVDAAFNVSNMAYGIISAFEQSGRPVPPVADVGANGAALAYWRDHPSYPGVAVSLPTKATAVYAMNIGMAMLQGRGLKVNETTFVPTVITSKNLSQWAEASFNSSSNVYADGPSSAIPIKDLLDGYFTK